MGYRPKIDPAELKKARKRDEFFTCFLARLNRNPVTGMIQDAVREDLAQDLANYAFAISERHACKN